ncbi:uncharacterized protein LOC134841070 isoform X3 [Symsagittifera roscoffensis]|uniref:uncharacterized protein LOC134841070 isoform X3 n=1 Tax=Symsagittifera roscoffensis TaxID=84072 RepID=UPI00307BC5E9
MSSDSDLKFTFTIDDVRKQLKILGYNSVPDSKLAEFAQDLRKLIEYDQRKNKCPSASGDHANTSSVSGKTGTDADCSSTLEESQISYDSKDGGDRRGGVAAYSSSPEQHLHARHHNALKTAAGAQGQNGQPRDRSKNSRKMKRVTAPRKSAFNSSSVTGANDPSVLDLDRSLTGGENSEENEEWRQLYQRGLSAVSECKRPQHYYKPPSSARPDLRPSHDENKPFNPHLPRSFIRPTPSPSSASHVTKTSARARSSDPSHFHAPPSHISGGEKRNDPVSRFNAYNEAWKERKAPGEQNRNQLRWRIREQMAVAEEVNKKRNLKPPSNPYVVPTDKKRQDLRWEVRCNLAAHKPGAKNTQYY